MRVIAAVLLASLASASPAHAGEWNRIALPDGIGSISMPCQAAEVKAGNDNGKSVLGCGSNGVAYVVIAGGLPSESGVENDYDQALAEAREDRSVTMHERTLSGRRAFGAEPGDDLTALEIIEVAPGNLMLLLFQVERPDVAKLDMIETKKLSEQFISSVELTAK